MDGAETPNTETETQADGNPADNAVNPAKPVETDTEQRKGEPENRGERIAAIIGGDGKNGVVREKGRIFINAVASTDTPVRAWGSRFEVLGHEAGEIQTGGITGMPVLVGHDKRSPQIGKVRSYSVQDGKMRVRMELDYGNPDAMELAGSIERGFAGAVSIGYIVTQWKNTEQTDGRTIWRATRWNPVEVSFVGLPADKGAAAGRSLQTDDTEYNSHIRKAAASSAPDGVGAMEDNGPDNTQFDEYRNLTEQLSERCLEAETPDLLPTAISKRWGMVELERAISDQRLERAKEAEGKMAEAEKKAADDEADEGQKSAEAEARADLNEGGERVQAELLTRNVGSTIGGPYVVTDPTQYSLHRALAMAASDKQESGIESEVSKEMHSRFSYSDSGSIAIPDHIIAWRVLELKAQSHPDPERREHFRTMLTEIQSRVQNSTNAANLIGTDHLASAFIEVLRDMAPVLAAGVRILPNLVEDVDIPRQTGITSAAWVSETGAPTETNSTFDKVSLTMRTLAAKVSLTRHAIKRTLPMAEGIVAQDLAMTFAEELSEAILLGTGADNSPTGIANTTNIRTLAVTGTGTGNAALAQPTWAQVNEMEGLIGDENFMLGDSTTCWFSRSLVRSGLRAKPRTAPGDSSYVVETNNTCLSYPWKAWNRTPRDKIYLGDFSQVFLGLWGSFEIRRDIHVDNGGAVLRAYHDADVAIRHPEAFCEATFTP